MKAQGEAGNPLAAVTSMQEIWFGYTWNTFPTQIVQKELVDRTVLEDDDIAADSLQITQESINLFLLNIWSFNVDENIFPKESLGVP